MIPGGSKNIALAILIHFSALSMMAIGGGVVALAPDMQRFLVDTHHWMTNEAFLTDFTIAQVAPGPNMLFVTLVGMQAAGWLGALAATIGIVMPPALFTLATIRLSARKQSTRLGSILKPALAPLSVGMMIATGWSLTHVAVHGAGAAILCALTVIAVLCTRLNPLWFIALGAVGGVLGLV